MISNIGLIQFRIYVIDCLMNTVGLVKRFTKRFASAAVARTRCQGLHELRKQRIE